MYGAAESRLGGAGGRSEGPTAERVRCRWVLLGGTIEENGLQRETVIKRESVRDGISDSRLQKKLNENAAWSDKRM